MLPECIEFEINNLCGSSLIRNSLISIPLTLPKCTKFSLSYCNKIIKIPLSLPKCKEFTLWCCSSIVNIPLLPKCEKFVLLGCPNVINKPKYLWRFITIRGKFIGHGEIIYSDTYMSKEATIKAANDEILLHYKNPICEVIEVFIEQVTVNNHLNCSSDISYCDANDPACPNSYSESDYGTGCLCYGTIKEAEDDKLNSINRRIEEFGVPFIAIYNGKRSYKKWNTSLKQEE